MDSALVSSSTDSFITGFQTILGENIGAILLFSAGILVWFVMKKWVFGGAGRV